MFRIVSPSITLITLTAAVGPVFAQSGPERSAVIVVFSGDTSAPRPATGQRPNATAGTDDASFYLADDVKASVEALERRLGFRATHIYSAALRGFAASLSAEQIADLQSDPSVAYVESDAVVTIDAQAPGRGQWSADVSGDGVAPGYEPVDSIMAAQVLPWGIRRIGADRGYAVAGDGAGAVQGVTVYVIDTGVAAHPDLMRVKHVSFIKGKNDDCNGHGTHVAGTIAAIDNSAGVVGVAPGAPIVGVKVLDCSGSGTISGVIKGVDWVTANAGSPAVANMSLGGSASQALDDAVRRSTAAGIVYAVAAGNSGGDACLVSPARAGAGVSSGVMTVAAIDREDKEPSFSNYGQCVDVWAPGVGVYSTYGARDYSTLSGTSMASPHVAGAAVLYLNGHPGASSAEVEEAILAASNQPGTVSKDAAPVVVPDVIGF
jgi:subtilisin family serine protease